MPDKISKADRELINRAIEDGKVQKIPIGEIKIPMNLSNAEVHDYIVRNSVHKNHMKNKERREKIMRMVNNGVELRVISKSMRISMENLEKVIDNSVSMQPQKDT